MWLMLMAEEKSWVSYTNMVEAGQVTSAMDVIRILCGVPQCLDKKSILIRCECCLCIDIVNG
jgi:hypothetical protein